VAILEALAAVVGTPTVLAGHSYGAVVAQAIALRGYVTPGALVLFETVALRLLPVAGEAQAYEDTKAVFDDYISSFQGGDDRAFRRIIDFWFGSGAFDAMPESVQAYLLKETSHNIRDVQATFREEYSVEGLRNLRMPVVAVCGARSPEVTRKMAQAIAIYARKGSILCMQKANHALTTTHVDEVARIIGDLATNASQLALAADAPQAARP
jgi:pimeloyl-ACP methyl ester carboxylesterase